MKRNHATVNTGYDMIYNDLQTDSTGSHHCTLHKKSHKLCDDLTVAAPQPTPTCHQHPNQPTSAPSPAPQPPASHEKKALMLAYFSP